MINNEQISNKIKYKKNNLNYDLATGRDSPVNSASSTSKLNTSKRRASAPITSPSSNTIISPY
jgi:hypothetical protein